MYYDPHGFDLKKAEQHYREADAWRLAYEVALHRYRCWHLRWVARSFALEKERLRATGTPTTRRLLHEQIVEAHDRMLVELDGLHAIAGNIMGSEFAGRVTHEEIEGRELGGSDE